MERFNVFEIEMACHIAGQGQPILLVHGFPLDHEMWQHQIQCLSDHYQVIAPDLRGFGASQRGTAEMTMRQFACDLSELLQQVVGSDQVCFCGLSMGGYIAWEFYRAFKKRVSHLILCDTRAAADDEATARARRMTARSVLKYGMSELAQSMPDRLVSHAWQQSHPESVQQLRDSIRRASPQSVADGLFGMSIRQDATSLLTSIDCPTLLIVGEHDAISTPHEMNAIAAAIGNSRLVSVADAGHLAPIENPQVANGSICEFLDDERISA